MSRGKCIIAEEMSEELDEKWDSGWTVRIPVVGRRG